MFTQATTVSFQYFGMLMIYSFNVVTSKLDGGKQQLKKKILSIKCIFSCSDSQYLNTVFSQYLNTQKHMASLSESTLPSSPCDYTICVGQSVQWNKICFACEFQGCLLFKSGVLLGNLIIRQKKLAS